MSTQNCLMLLKVTFLIRNIAYSRLLKLWKLSKLNKHEKSKILFHCGSQSTLNGYLDQPTIKTAPPLHYWTGFIQKNEGDVFFYAQLLVECVLSPLRKGHDHTFLQCNRVTNKERLGTPSVMNMGFIHNSSLFHPDISPYTLLDYFLEKNCNT